jgi:hypothetical protein
VIQQKKDERPSDRTVAGTSVAEKSVPNCSQEKEIFIEPAELTLLLQFFDLLAEWNESQEGETKG